MAQKLFYFSLYALILLFISVYRHNLRFGIGYYITVDVECSPGPDAISGKLPKLLNIRLLNRPICRSAIRNIDYLATTIADLLAGCVFMQSIELGLKLQRLAVGVITKRSNILSSVFEIGHLLVNLLG